MIFKFLLEFEFLKMKDREVRKMEDSSPTDSLSSVEANLPAQWKMERQADADEQWFNDDDSEVDFFPISFPSFLMTLKSEEKNI